MDILKWFVRVFLILLVIAILLYLRSIQNFSNRLQPDEERVYQNKKAKKKALVIFQDSRHGTVGRFVGIVKDLL